MRWLGAHGKPWAASNELTEVVTTLTAMHRSVRVVSLQRERWEGEERQSGYGSSWAEWTTEPDLLVQRLRGCKVVLMDPGLDAMPGMVGDVVVSAMLAYAVPVLVGSG